jgi:hypothetical protein
MNINFITTGYNILFNIVNPEYFLIFIENFNYISVALILFFIIVFGGRSIIFSKGQKILGTAHKLITSVGSLTIIANAIKNGQGNGGGNSSGSDNNKDKEDKAKDNADPKDNSSKTDSPGSSASKE